MKKLRFRLADCAWAMCVLSLAVALCVVEPDRRRAYERLERAQVEYRFTLDLAAAGFGREYGWLLRKESELPERPNLSSTLRQQEVYAEKLGGSVEIPRDEYVALLRELKDRKGITESLKRRLAVEFRKHKYLADANTPVGKAEYTEGAANFLQKRGGNRGSYVDRYPELEGQP